MNVRVGRQGGRRGAGARLIMALIVAGAAIFSFIGSREFNPVTGENQYISLTQEQEIALGLQAVPQMITQHGGLYPDPELQEYVDEIGYRLVQYSEAADLGYQYEFHLLADPETINAFALPGGPVFITMALYEQLETEGQLAGVLGHEIAHVVARHGAQRMANAELTEGLIGAVVVASSDPDRPQSGQQAAQVAAYVGQMVNMKYGRDDELESDRLGVRFMLDAGYDPRAMIGVMEILAAAGGGARQPEFFSTHPNPDNRIGQIEAAIAAELPNGVPDGLIP
jgi:predicted Zn-dependent protease